MLIHGTCVAGAGIGILLRGPSGSGKSDLALRLINDGFRLVADDQVLLQREGDTVTASPPAVLAGLIEVYGVGIMPMPHESRAIVALVVDLVAPDAVERMPQPDYCRLLEREIRRIDLAPFQVAAPAKLRLLAAAIAQRQTWPQ
ncbi:MAG: HPr kinase/phosphatase C-terminal domain-containing protein [Azospirillaceae bacterium]|nr:HPr kinase/phosphatase C-terminal domain-containing protein [Azospirillaceae bacterium]